MAIAFDNTARFSKWNTTGNQVSGSFTVGSGANKILLFGTARVNTAAISSITYNGVALTQLNTVTNGSVTCTIHYLLNPAAGSNTAQITIDTNDRVAFVAASYTGVDQDDAFDVSNTGTGTNTANANLTTTENNLWLVATGSVDNAVTSFTGVTERHSLSINTANYGDSNGTVSAGAQTIAINGTADARLCSTSLRPAPDSNTFFMLF